MDIGNSVSSDSGQSFLNRNKYSLSKFLIILLVSFIFLFLIMRSFGAEIGTTSANSSKMFPNNFRELVSTKFKIAESKNKISRLATSNAITIIDKGIPVRCSNQNNTLPMLIYNLLL